MISPASLILCGKVRRWSLNWGITKGHNILDLGCGGDTTAIPEAKAGANVLGVDISGIFLLVITGIHQVNPFNNIFRIPNTLAIQSQDFTSKDQARTNVLASIAR